MLFNGKYYNKPGHLGMTRAELKKAVKALPTPEAGDAGKAVVVNADADGYELGTAGGGGVNPDNAPYINLTIAEYTTLTNDGVISKQLSGYTAGTYSELIVINVESGTMLFYLRPIAGYFDDGTLIISHYAAGMYSADASKYMIFTYIADDNELRCNYVTTL